MENILLDIVLVILLVISLAIIAYFISQNHRPKEKRQSKNKERNKSTDKYEIPATNDGNGEQVENEQSMYTTLKRPGERDDDNDHVYTHLINAQKVYMNQEENRF